MSELRSLVAAARSLRRSGDPFLVATLVSVKGSSYRRPGARLIMAAGPSEPRWMVGSVSGGCLERDLVRKAWWATEKEGAALLTYDSTSDDDDAGWGMGLGCNGVVELLLQRAGVGRQGAAAGGDGDGVCISAIDPLDFIEGCLVDERPGALVTVFRASQGELPLGACVAVREDRPRLSPASSSPLDDLLVDHACSALASLGPPRLLTLGKGIEAMVEVIRPPPHLFVFGAGPDAVPVVRAARAVGWTSTVWTHNRRREAEKRFASADHLCDGPVATMECALAAAHRPLALVMSHNFAHDREALGMLLGSSCAYIGVLGPRRRTEKLLEELPGSPRPGDPRLARLHAPVGLALGAETPDEVALSMIAEAQAVLAGDSAGFLRDRGGPIHATEPVPSTASRQRPLAAVVSSPAPPDTQ